MSYHQQVADFERYCPIPDRAIRRKRYLLPNKLQSEYFNQGHLYLRAQLVLYNYALGYAISGKQHPTTRTEVMTVLKQLQYDTPTLFLEQSLGKALLRTELPKDITTDDVKWPWPAFRIMLPKGLCTAQTDHQTITTQLIDLILVEANEQIGLNSETFEQWFGLLRRTGEQLNSDPRLHTFPQKMMIGSYPYQFNNEPRVGHWLTVWNNGELKELAKTNNAKWLESLSQIQSQLHDQIHTLVFNVLLYLNEAPIIYNSEQFLRKPRLEGKHHRPGLSKAQFVSECRSYLPTKPITAEKHDPTGITRAPHWVRGHWTRVAHGPRHTLRRLTWIQPYFSGRKEEDL